MGAGAFSSHHCLAAALRAVAAVAAVTAEGCEVPTTPADAQPISPLPVYAVWWQQVEACSGLSGDLSRVEWYVVPCEAGESGFPCEATPDGLCGGEWLPPHMILLGGPNGVLPDGYADDEFTVKHEMLHDLSGSAEHTDLFTDCHLVFR
jgi:hypothetical protein